MDPVRGRGRSGAHGQSGGRPTNWDYNGGGGPPDDRGGKKPWNKGG